MVGTADTVLIREVSLIQSVLYREVPLYSQLKALSQTVLHFEDTPTAIRGGSHSSIT